MVFFSSLNPLTATMLTTSHQLKGQRKEQPRDSDSQVATGLAAFPCYELVTLLLTPSVFRNRSPLSNHWFFSFYTFSITWSSASVQLMPIPISMSDGRNALGGLRRAAVECVCLHEHEETNSISESTETEPSLGSSLRPPFLTAQRSDGLQATTSHLPYWHYAAVFRNAPRSKAKPRRSVEENKSPSELGCERVAAMHVHLWKSHTHKTFTPPNSLVTKKLKKIFFSLSIEAKVPKSTSPSCPAPVNTGPRSCAEDSRTEHVPSKHCCARDPLCSA